MRNIIGAFGILMVLAIYFFSCIELSNAGIVVAEAKEFKAEVIAEIENSNFNPKVIEGCIAQAEAVGYQLVVTTCVYDEKRDMRSAEVILTYKYHIPFLGIEETKTTRGIAR